MASLLGIATMLFAFNVSAQDDGDGSDPPAPSSSHKKGVPDYLMFDWNLRSIVGMGFYPFGGNATVKSSQFATYIIGPGLDFFTFNETRENMYGVEQHKQITLINLSAYLHCL